MPYVERDTNGVVTSALAHPVAGIAEEWQEEASADVKGFREKMEKARRNPAPSVQAQLDAIKSILAESGITAEQIDARVKRDAAK